MTDCSPLKVLDCTLRDGGYYNLWNFNREIAQAYLDSMSAARVDYVEIGFRQPPQNQFLGAFAYSTDDYISTFDIPKNLKIGVMIDAKTYLKGPQPADTLDVYFSEKSKSPVSLVRIAAQLAEAKNCGQLIKKLKEKGYEVAVNLMQIGGKSETEIAVIASYFEACGNLNALYIADSFGNMDFKEVYRLAKVIKKNTNLPLGIHTHNNKSNALSNTLTAINEGFEWLDATVLGMGRGAGNTPTESLLLELEVMGKNYSAHPLFALIDDHFGTLREKHKWGPNIYYHYAALHNIHPSYIQDLMSDNRYNHDEIAEILKQLSINNTTSYSPTLIQNALQPCMRDETHGTWNADNWLTDREVLLIGAGETVEEHKIAIEQYIHSRRPVVVSVNVNRTIDTRLIDYYVASNRSRLKMEIKLYKGLEEKLILPRSHLDSSLSDAIDVDKIRDYGIFVQPGKWLPQSNTCTVPNELTFSYALAVLVAGGGKTIFLAGFDGYTQSDPRLIEMTKTIELMQKRHSEIEITAITPTLYPVRKGSVYAR